MICRKNTLLIFEPNIAYICEQTIKLAGIELAMIPKHRCSIAKYYLLKQIYSAFSTQGYPLTTPIQ